MRAQAPGAVECRYVTDICRQGSTAALQTEQYSALHMPQVGLHDDMDNPLHAGRRPILRWTVRMRLDTSGESNPAVNRKAVCKV